MYNYGYSLCITLCQPCHVPSPAIYKYAIYIPYAMSRSPLPASRSPPLPLLPDHRAMVMPPSFGPPQNGYINHII